MKALTAVSPTLLAALFLSGCSQEDEWTRKQPATVSADGIVTLDGKPVDGASIIIAPIAPGQHAANALTDGTGRFSLAAFPSKPGAVPGSYKVRVAKTVEVSAEPVKIDLGEDAAHAAAESSGANVTWINVLPEKYANPETSGITVEIPTEGVKNMTIELTAK